MEKEGIIPFCHTCNQFRFPIYNTAVSMIVVDRKNKKILLIQQYDKYEWIDYFIYELDYELAEIYGYTTTRFNEQVKNNIEKFFEEMGYEDVAYEVVRGRMSCDIAIIEIKKSL